MGWVFLTAGVVAIVVFVSIVALHDITQKKHTILRNFPVVGRMRYLLERFGPEMRQYFVAMNDEELPFSRDERTWVYASAKGQNSLAGFGTDNDVEGSPNYVILRHATFPYAYGGDSDVVSCAKVLGGARERRHAFRPESIINTSAMSYGSLSHAAVRAINTGANLAGCLQNTGEGGIAPHHDHGGGLIWQIGTGYFGCRNKDGSFDLGMLKDRVERFNIRALEVKLSQGAKPGKGGVLPGSKVTREIADIRGVPLGETVYSPAHHSAFNDASSLLDFVEMLAEQTGLPVGIKSAVGQTDFWDDLAQLIDTTNRSVDHIQIDGGEGGTGAAPMSFADHVSLPFKQGFPEVYRRFAEHGVHNDIVWIGSGKLGFPIPGLLAMAMGCDMIAVAREAMLSIGCIQAQKCHTGHCPTGVATNKPWLVRGLDPTLKAARFANYVKTLRKEMLELSHAVGVGHPALLRLEHFEILNDRLGRKNALDLFGYSPTWTRTNAKSLRDAGLIH
ncbi:MAG: glutamate synthase domain-containing protein 2 [Myxococcota bacterium]